MRCNRSTLDGPPWYCWRKLLAVLFLSAILGCESRPPDKLLHHVSSPDGHRACTVFIQYEYPGEQLLYVVWGPAPKVMSVKKKAHLKGVDFEKYGIRADILRVDARFEDITSSDFKVAWPSDDRLEVTGFRTDKRIIVQQNEDGIWRDRRTWEDRALNEK